MFRCSTRLVLPSSLLLALALACGDDESKGGASDSPKGGGGEPSSSAEGGRDTLGGAIEGGESNGRPGKAGAPGTEGGSSDPGGAAGAPSAVDCSLLASPPANFQILTGFTESEDFAFDQLGNYVGVDGDFNLVRVSKTGKRELWAPNVGGTAGMAMLPDGSAIIADVVNGALKRFYPNGASETVIGGLLYPNGLDIGPDGFIYVAENDAGRVRRVDPDTGEFTIVAMGLHGPNGVAVTDDPRLLYVGSFEGSGVYKVEVAKLGELGVASVFARPHGSTLREPSLDCPDQVVGKACVSSTRAATGFCRQLANVVDCVPTLPCEGKADGDACDGDGTCSLGECISGGDCSKDPELATCPCRGLSEGDACLLPVSQNPGRCQLLGGVSLECWWQDPCTGQADGLECTPEFASTPSGKCRNQMCYTEPCANAALGDACWSTDGVGRCEGVEGSPLQCKVPCLGKVDGDECNVGQLKGQCTKDVCYLPCNASTLGEPCLLDGEQGTCSDAANGPLCVPNRFDEPGGIDGLGVDACGFVYATEFTNGNVWRISPAGDIEKLVQLPSGWIPNVKWGRGLGGFDRNTMYVADRDDSRLFAVEVGVPGVTEYYDIGEAP